METLTTLYTVSGLFLVLIALPLIANKIKPNYWYGFRVRQTLENPQIWYQVNCYAGKRLLAAGIAILISGIAFSFIPGISVDAYALACLAVTCLALGIGLGQSWRYMKSLSGE